MKKQDDKDLKMMSPEESSITSRLNEALRSKTTRQNAIRNYLGYQNAVKARSDVSKQKDTTENTETEHNQECGI